MPEDESPHQPGRLGRLLRWLMPNGGTLLLIAILLLTQNVWARHGWARWTACWPP